MNAAIRNSATNTSTNRLNALILISFTWTRFQESNHEDSPSLHWSHKNQSEDPNTVQHWDRSTEHGRLHRRKALPNPYGVANEHHAHEEYDMPSKFLSNDNNDSIVYLGLFVKFFHRFNCSRRLF